MRDVARSEFGRNDAAADEMRRDGANDGFYFG
jgi:hypothetical protein